MALKRRPRPRRSGGRGVGDSRRQGVTRLAAGDQLSRPGDLVFLRARRLDEQLRAGSRTQRLGAGIGLLVIAAKLVRHRSEIARHRLMLTPGVGADALTTLMTRPLGPFTAPRLLFVLELGAAHESDSPAPVYEAGSGAEASPGNELGLLHLLDPVTASAAKGLGLLRVLDPVTAFAAYKLCQGRSPSEMVAGDQQLRDVQALPQATTIVAVDQRQIFVGLGTVLTEGADAYLVSLVARPDHGASLSALEMIHDALVMGLIDAEVQRLWADGPLASDLHRQLFARDHGYRAAWVRLYEGDASRGW